MASYDFEKGDLDFLDIISITSFCVGLLNLDLNEKQVSNLEQHLSMQDENLLSKIIEQNEIIIRQNQELLNFFKNKEVKNE